MTLSFIYAEQSAAIDVLMELLAEAELRGLPVLHWSVYPGRVLTGHLLGASEDELRQRFAAWVDFLAAQRLDDDVSPELGLVLRASQTYRRCLVRLRAELGASAALRGDSI